MSTEALTGGPPAVLGTMTFGDTADEVEAGRIVHMALDHGVTEIDTANAYAAGATEEILGRVLPRKGITIATKVGMPSADADGLPALSAVAIDRCVAASLRRLRRDRVDVLYLHQPDRTTPIEETVTAVRRLVESGAVGALGVSNFAAWQIEQLRTVAASAGLDVVVAQQVYSPVARRIEAEYAEYALSTHLRTVVYNPLAGGLLTGRYRSTGPSDSGRFATSRLGEMYRGRYWSDEVLSAVDALSAIADDAGLSMIELSLRWALAQPVVAGVLLGASTAEQLTSTLMAIGDGPLDDALTARVMVATDVLLGVAPAYNR